MSRSSMAPLGVAIALVGYLWGFARFAWQMLKNFVVGFFRSPMMLLDWTSRRYFQPGVPWLAFLLLLAGMALVGGRFRARIPFTSR